MASKKVHRIVVLDDHETYCPVDESVVIEVTEEELQELEAGITKVKYLEGFVTKEEEDLGHGESLRNRSCYIYWGSGSLC